MTRSAPRTRSTPASLAALACAAALLALNAAGCASGSSTPPPGPGASGTVGTAGGVVEGGDGASVVVPAGALAADTPIAIGRAPPVAPALPVGVEAAGGVWAVTPHGQVFGLPVTVQVPAPARPLGPDQRWAIAKAEATPEGVPAGDWTLLGGVTASGGKLSVEVQGFSFFAPVVVTLTPADGEPMRVTKYALTCDGKGGFRDRGQTLGECGDLGYGPTDLEARVTTAGTRLPGFCVPGTGGVVVRANLTFHAVAGEGVLEDGAWVVRLPGAEEYPNHFATFPGRIGLSCASATDPGQRRVFDEQEIPIGKWPLALPAPYLMAFRPPQTTLIVEGHEASVPAVFLGGAREYSQDVQRVTGTISQTNQAVIDWERSEDEGRSWRLVARSYELEAETQFLGGNSWIWGKYWRVQHRFVASAADHGALLRVRGCWAKPGQATVCDTSPPTRLVALAASAFPAFTALPAPVAVRTGQAATFTAAATGTPAPALRWQTRPANSTGDWADATSGTGATAGAYTTAPLSLADNGRQYRVVAANAVGEIASPAVTASVSDLDVAPSITTQPANLAVAAGGDAVLAAAARGTEPLSWQWRFGGAAIPGATGPVLRLGAVTAAQAGRYDVVVTNAAGSATSDLATLDVTAGAPPPVAPAIVTQPAAATVHAGDTATFAVGVSGTGPFAFQWHKGADPIPGATAAAYTIPAAAAGDAATYAVRVTGVAGTATSQGASLTVLPSTALTPPAITTQPSPQAQPPGGSATFAVAASGSGPLAYQWFRNGAPVAGATGPVLTLAGVSAADAGSYAVTVANALGTATSDPAVLTVIGAPVISAQPAAAVVVEGESATFAVAASGSGLRYQWLRDGAAIPGATDASYTAPPASVADAGSVFAVVVANGAGLVVSDGAVLTVMAAPPRPGFRRVSGLWRHACAVTLGGRLACWGDGLAGQLGNGLAEPSLVPVQASVSEVLSVSAGADSTCVIEAGGALFCWGAMTDSLGATGVALPGGRAASVAVGRDHACAVDEGGGVACWGWGPNEFGELGDGTTAAHAAPQPVLLAEGSPLAGAVAVAAGDDLSCAQLSGGEVFCWGRGALQAVRPNPVQVMRQLGDGSQIPLMALGQLQAGVRHACAVERGSHQPACWGFNEAGQLGDGTTAGRDHATLVALAGVGAVVAGATHSCGIRDADVFCWGTAHMGNGGPPEQLLGIGEPNRVAALAGAAARVDAGAAGNGFTCAHWTTGDLQCWGVGDTGQLGVGDTDPRAAPTSTAAGPIF